MIEDKDIPYGVYVWEMPTGQWIGDGEGNFLSIDSMYGDLKRIAQITAVVRNDFNIDVGKPVFLRNRRKVSDQEYAEQLERQSRGETPDEYDIPALVEELVYNDRKQ